MKPIIGRKYVPTVLDSGNRCIRVLGLNGDTLTYQKMDRSGKPIGKTTYCMSYPGDWDFFVNMYAPEEIE